MKKKILCLVMLLCVLLVPFSAEAKTTKKTKKKTTTTTQVVAKEAKPVNVYIFYGSTCGYCKALHEYTATLEKDDTIKDKFNIVDYEVWADSTNATLMTKVGAYFNKEVKGVPFMVIGDKTFDGYASSMDAEIRTTIEEAYKNQTKDVVATIGTGNVLKYVADAGTAKVETAKTENTSSKTAAYIIVGVTVIIILLIVFGRSKDESYYEEDEEVEEDDDEVEDDEDDEDDDEDEEDDDDDEEDEEEKEEKPRQVVKKTNTTKAKANKPTTTKTKKRK